MSDEKIISIRIGEKFPSLPEEYHSRADQPPGLACLITDDSGPRGMVAFIKDSVLIKIMSLMDMSDDKIPPDVDYDGLIMHPDDVPEDALHVAVNAAKKYFN